MSSLYVQGRNKNHHHSDDDGDEMANGNRTHKIHVCMLLSDTTLPLPPPPSHSWAKSPKPAKNEIHKIREINWLYYASNSLTNFESEGQESEIK